MIKHEVLDFENGGEVVKTFTSKEEALDYVDSSTLDKLGVYSHFNGIPIKSTRSQDFTVGDKYGLKINSNKWLVGEATISEKCPFHYFDTDEGKLIENDSRILAIVKVLEN